MLYAICLYLIAWTFQICGFAQVAYCQGPVFFKHLTVEHGLSSSSVLSFTQDKSGFIWIGTMDGLNRFDGRKMKVFKSFYKDNIIEQNIQINKLMADEKQNIWIGTNNGLYIYDTAQDSFQVLFQSGRESPRSLTNNNIKAIWEDHQGYVWVGTEAGLNKIASEQNGKYRFLPIDSNLQGKNIQTIFEDGRKHILVGTTSGLFIVPDKRVSGKKYETLAAELIGKEITCIAEDQKGQLWIGTNRHGLYKIDQGLANWKRYTHVQGKDSGLTSNHITKIAMDGKGRIWLGTLKGLNLYDPTRDDFKTFQHNSADRQSLSNNGIFDLYVDKQGSVWIATFFGGVNIIEALTTNFKVYQTSDQKNSISSNIISAVAEGTDNNLWVGTEDEGLNLFDRKRKTFHHYKNSESVPSSLGSNNVKALLKDTRGRMWIGLYNGGLDLFENKVFKHFRYDDKINPIKSNDVTCLLEDRNKMIWIGHQARGINIYDPEARKMTTLESLYPGQKLSNSYITCFFQDSKNNIWIGTKQGLNRVDANGRSIKYFLRKQFPDQLNSDIINCVTEDKNNVIWIGTYAGLTRYDPAKNKFKTFTLTDGLSGNMIVGILVDDKNNLWLSTNNGLSKFDVSSGRFSIYNTHDGLPANVFNYSSFYKDSKANLFFGSHNGLVEFLPQEIETNHTAPEVKLTGLYLAGRQVTARDPSRILSKSITDTKGLTLSYDQNLVSIEYAILNLIKPEKSMSAYKLEGYDKNWVYTHSPTASFTNLPTGKYSLLVKSCNNDGGWGKQQKLLEIVILPPFWLTWWAYTFYILLTFTVTGGIFYFFNSRAILLRNLRFEQMTSAKQREVHQMKMDFFTHISHEIRTPLTMIMGPVEMLKSLIPPKSSNQKLVSSIQNNAERLLKLTNDLMDFRKADAGHTQLKIAAGDIIKFSKSIYEKFTENASVQQIDYNFSSTHESVILYFDPEHLEIVLTNLLSNALKFTPGGKRISMQISLTAEFTEIKVIDSGIGISAEDQSKIFTNFYQIDAIGNKKPGSGIGLAFSKSLIELHHGKISFYSILNKDNENETCFSVFLRLGKDHFDKKAFE
ncbi:two-component regulator propeller domain-containing protein [Pedobacter sp. BAL39]|uniref:ligand-binding sensor domain-containing protein n=1 Tax=Pedobacter sp. BAL39 TaxID=391596 RepID=UPI0018DCD578|nr:sensor histidine kinase [Pedobacter sp. BAL39]